MKMELLQKHSKFDQQMVELTKQEEEHQQKTKLLEQKSKEFLAQKKNGCPNRKQFVVFYFFSAYRGFF